MSYHRDGLGEPFTIPRQPTDTEIAYNRAAHNALDEQITRNGAITREQVLYMFGTMPVCDSWGGPPCPPYPSDVKVAVERMTPGATVPAVWVRKVYVLWNPGGMKF